MTAPSFERIDLAQIAPQPWKNGAGLTREIAVHPAGAGLADFDWRVSVAEVARDAPFSAFPGVDRCITLLRGAGMRLASEAGAFDARLDRPLLPLYFSGDLPLSATLIDGPCSDLNVMTRRGIARCEVTRHDIAVDLAAVDLPAAEACLLWCCGSDAWQVGEHHLAPMQGLLWRADSPALSLRPLGHGALLEIRFCQDRSR